MRARARQALGRLVQTLVDGRRLAVLARLRGVCGVVLNYHSMRAHEMEEHARILRRLVRLVSLEEMLQVPGTRGAADLRLPATLTVDDGKRSHLTEIAPVLRAAGIPCAFFVTSEPCATGVLHWFDYARHVRAALATCPPDEAVHDRLCREHDAVFRVLRTGRRRTLLLDGESLKRLGAAHRAEVLSALGGYLGVDPRPGDDDEQPLTPAEVGALCRMGFTVGSHSATHPVLTREPPERVWWEVTESKRRIAEWIGETVRHFCYPNGNSSDATEALTRRAGYESAWTTVPLGLGPRENPHRLPRIQIHASDGEPEIVVRLVRALFGTLSNPDGTGFSYRRRWR